METLRPQPKVRQESPLSLRAPEPEDLDFLYRYENAPERFCEGTATRPLSRHALREFIAIQGHGEATDDQLRLIVQTNADGGPVGCVDFYRVDHIQGTGCIGLGIFPAEQQGKGYGRLALGMGVDFAYDSYNLRALLAEILEGNERSLHLFAQAGFSQVGRLPRWFRSGEGQVHDMLLFQHSRPGGRG